MLEAERELVRALAQRSLAAVRAVRLAEAYAGFAPPGAPGHAERALSAPRCLSVDAAWWGAAAAAAAARVIGVGSAPPGAALWSAAEVEAGARAPLVAEIAWRGGRYGACHSGSSSASEHVQRVV
jgi:hypothetical protein